MAPTKKPFTQPPDHEKNCIQPKRRQHAHSESFSVCNYEFALSLNTDSPKSSIVWFTAGPAAFLPTANIITVDAIPLACLKNLSVLLVFVKPPARVTVYLATPSNESACWPYANNVANKKFENNILYLKKLLRDLVFSWNRILIEYG